jgi:glycosyltransferase involved in cell wall biosynthesis
MKILHVIPSVSIIHGGPSLAVFGMVKALINQGVSVEILTTNDDGKDILDVPIEQKTIYRGVPCIFCHCLSYFSKYAVSSNLAQWLWNNIKKYDLIHIHSIFSYSSTVAMSIARYYKIPYVVRPLGQLCQWSLKQNFLVKKIYLRMIGYDNINHAKAIHYTAEQEKQEVKSLSFDPQPCVIPLGIDIPDTISDAELHIRDILGISDKAPLILFLSRIHPKKGLDYLIRSLANVSSQFSFHLIIAGDGKEEDKQVIDQLIDNFHLRERTHFVGFVQGETKNLLLQGSDLFALTSHSENFGIVVIEAMAAGLPLLLTRGVALAPIVEENQLGYIADLNEDSIVKSLKIFFENRLQKDEISQKNKKYVENNFSWDTISIKLISLYESILS